MQKHTVLTKWWFCTDWCGCSLAETTLFWIHMSWMQETWTNINLNPGPTQLLQSLLPRMRVENAKPHETHFFFVQLETGVLRKSDPLGRGIRPLLKSNHSRTDEDEELWEKIRCALWDHDMPRVLHRGISWHPYKTNSTMDYMTSNWVTRQHAQFLPMFNLTTTNHGFWKWGAQMWSGPTPTCEIRLPGFGWFTIQIPWWVESWQFVVIFGSRFINLSG